MITELRKTRTKLRFFLILEFMPWERGLFYLNKNLFRAMHTAHGDTQKQVADILGIAEQTLSAKVNGETDFKHSEIKTLIDWYELTPEQVDEIFFDK